MKKVLLFIILLAFSSIFKNANATLKPANENEIPSTAEKAYTGVYLMNVYDIDMSANSYYADFYLWCKWKGDIDPLENIEFVNFVEKWGFTKTAVYDTVQVLDNGFNYNVIRVEGRFYHAFSLQKFPLDRQNLDIQIENSEYTTKDLVYVVDEGQSGVRKEYDLPGWDIKGHTIKSFINIYDTNFGMPDVEKEEYSNFTYELNITRPISFFLWKLLLPLIVVVVSSLGTMMIFPGFIDARISLPVGALLAAVFLQQSYTSALPDVGYMVLMDKVYVLSYVLIIANLVESIITANRASSEEEEDYQKVRRFDFKYAIISIVIFLSITAVIVMTS